MNQKIRDYIAYLFEKAPKTRAAVDLREEIIANAEEKMRDLLAQGYKEEDAFAIVIHSIGNVEELFSELRSEDAREENRPEEAALRKKRAVITATAVGMYIFAGTVFFFIGFLEENISEFIYETRGMALHDVSMLGLVLAGLICIVPTAMLVYSSIALVPSYKKKEDSMVEEYKEWKSGTQKDKAVRGAVGTIIWTLGVAVYLIVSFRTGAWGVTWIIFLILGCIDSIVSLVFSLKSKD